jgi:hypothetical protein
MAAKHPIDGGHGVLGILRRKAQHDKRGGAIRSQKKSRPERALPDVVEHLRRIAVWNIFGLLRPPSHRADIDDTVHTAEFFREGKKSQQVGSRDKPR